MAESSSLEGPSGPPTYVGGMEYAGHMTVLYPEDDRRPVYCSSGLLLIPVIEPGQFMDLATEGVQAHTAIPLEVLHLSKTCLGLRRNRYSVCSWELRHAIPILPRQMNRCWPPWCLIPVGGA